MPAGDATVVLSQRSGDPRTDGRVPGEGIRSVERSIQLGTSLRAEIWDEAA